MQNLRRLLAILAFAPLALQVAPAGATLLFYDDFNYAAVGSDLTGNEGGGSFGFSSAWSGQTSYNIGNGSLTAPGDPLPAVGNSVTAVAFGENRDIDRAFPSSLGTENTSLYASILLRPQGTLGQGAYGGWFALALRGSTDIFAGMIYGGTTYGVEVGFEKSLSNRNAVIGRTEFLVLRIDFTEGVDPVSLYVNPRPGAPEPSAPSASLINLNVESLRSLSLTGPGASSFDALRIGTTFLDVAPAVADFDLSGTVDGDDLAQWKHNYGSATALPVHGDANGDADVDGADFLVWQRQLGAGYTPAVVSIPETTSLLLGLAGALALLSGRTIATRQQLAQ